jgi:hypothetical protein
MTKIISGAGRRKRRPSFRQLGQRRPPAGHQLLLKIHAPAIVTANATKYPGPFSALSADKIHPTAHNHAENRIQSATKAMIL